MNFLSFFIKATLLIIFGKSLLVKALLLCLAIYYVYDAYTYYPDMLHNVGHTFDRIKARGG